MNIDKIPTEELIYIRDYYQEIFTNKIVRRMSRENGGYPLLSTEINERYRKVFEINTSLITALDYVIFTRKFNMGIPTHILQWKGYIETLTPILPKRLLKAV